MSNFDQLLARFNENVTDDSGHEHGSDGKFVSKGKHSQPKKSTDSTKESPKTGKADASAKSSQQKSDTPQLKNRRTDDNYEPGRNPFRQAGSHALDALSSNKKRLLDQANQRKDDPAYKIGVGGLVAATAPGKYSTHNATLDYLDSLEPDEFDALVQEIGQTTKNADKAKQMFDKVASKAQEDAEVDWFVSKLAKLKPNDLKQLGIGGGKNGVRNRVNQTFRKAELVKALKSEDPVKTYDDLINPRNGR